MYASYNNKLHYNLKINIERLIGPVFSGPRKSATTLLTYWWDGNYEEATDIICQIGVEVVTRSSPKVKKNIIVIIINTYFIFNIIHRPYKIF